MNEITEQEMVVRSHNGLIYLCRSCYDNKKKINLIKSIPGKKTGIIYTFCVDCTKLIEDCSRCKKY